jgi:predicted 3-demethylubiquinone-9 3-methyltransferase (glyoxalase superfamily)
MPSLNYRFKKGNTMQKITPHLWFDTQAEEAAHFYVSVFKDAKINAVSRYSSAGQEIHKMPVGSVMTVQFEIEGQTFLALNGGPIFTFNEAVSFMVNCETQEEIDYYWSKLSAVPESEQCGWLKDKFGVSWQVVPTGMAEMLSDPEAEKTQRAMAAFMQMKKIDIEKLKQAYNG